jgi:hypothetical protein
MWHVVTGRVPGTRFGPRIVRLAGVGQLLLGAGVIVSAFLVSAESPDQPPPVDHWGDTSDIVALAVWLMLLAAIGAWIVQRYRGRS